MSTFMGRATLDTYVGGRKQVPGKIDEVPASLTFIDHYTKGKGTSKAQMQFDIH